MTRIPKLTRAELDAVLSVAGDADAFETTSSVTESAREARAMLNAFERGTDKLRTALARAEEAARRRRLR